MHETGDNPLKNVLQHKMRSRCEAEQGGDKTWFHKSSGSLSSLH